MAPKGDILGTSRMSALLLACKTRKKYSLSSDKEQRPKASRTDKDYEDKSSDTNEPFVEQKVKAARRNF